MILVATPYGICSAILQINKNKKADESKAQLKKLQ
jgi:hypothetical protein